jgi:hypothetical protein
VEPQFLDEARGEVLVDGGRAAHDRDVAVAGDLTGLGQSGLDAVGDEGVGGAAFHRLRVARIVGEDEDRRVVGRVGAPPTVPVAVPFAADRSEHVAPHDERARIGQLVDFGAVLRGGVEHPGVQLRAGAVAAVVAERPVFGLVETGRVSVDGDRDAADHLAHARLLVGR